jgi:hypothetical protein
MLLDNVAQCAIRNTGCTTVFRSPGASDKKDRISMCPSCRDMAHHAILDVLKGKRNMRDMKSVKVSIGFMLSKKASWPTIFSQHIVDVDEKAWTAWWKSNVVGEDPQRPTHWMFFDSIIKEYAKTLPKQVEGMTQKMEIPEVAVPTEEPPTEPPTETVAEEPPAEVAEEPAPETSTEPVAEKPAEKKSRKKKGTQDAPAPGAVVKVSKKKELDPVQQAEKDAEKAIKKAEGNS